MSRALPTLTECHQPAAPADVASLSLSASLWTSAIPEVPVYRRPTILGPQASRTFCATNTSSGTASDTLCQVQPGLNTVYELASDEQRNHHRPLYLACTAMRLL